MAYVQHTAAEIEAMLAAIGVSSVGDLFSQVPEPIRLKRRLDIPDPLSEPEVLDHMRALARANLDLDGFTSFLGAGVYDHYLPNLVDYLAGRSEFFTSYTPYQPETSQGNLQAIFEYQTVICQLTGMEISNASLYEGATALAEAVLMALAIADAGPGSRVVVSAGVHPEYRRVLATYLKSLDVAIDELPLSEGRTDPATLAAAGPGATAVVFANPNFFGVVEDGRALRDAAPDPLLVACVDPISLGVLAPPGEYDADLAVGEGQSLGNHPAFGGPYFGFLASRAVHARRMPGRIVGETVDGAGRRGYVLTLQTREQHIRRHKATSNICTNQALNALRGLLHLVLLGRQGIRDVAASCAQKAHFAARLLSALPGYRLAWNAPFFKEFALRCPRPAAGIVEALVAERFLAGVPLSRYGMDDDLLLVAVTERIGRAEIERFAATLGRMS